MGFMDLLPPTLQVKYLAKKGIPFTKGYHKKYDVGYEENKKKVMEYQSVTKHKHKIETDILQEKGLAVQTRERESELLEQLKAEKNSFQNPNVVLDPYGRAPLCAYIMFYTEKECSVRFEVEGKTEETTIRDHVTVLCKWHRVPIYGLYPAKDNRVLLELLDQNGTVMDKTEVVVTTNPLPEFMTDLVRVEKHTAESAMKLILVAGKNTSYPIAFDQNGDVRYLMWYRPRGYGLFELANGRFIMMERQTLIPTYMIPHSTQMYEIDYFGRVYRTYYVPNGIHHDVCEMTPGGNLLVASNSQSGHVEDCIAEINRHNGRIERYIDTRDLLKTAYRDRTNWVHVNSLEYYPETKSVVFSARNLHTIVSFNWKSGKLNWILGEKNFWGMTPWRFKLLKTPEDMPWHFQQHSVKRIRENLDGNQDTMHLMVYDNHWNLRRRIEAYDDDPMSYVTIYTINENERTAKIEKRFAGVKSKITSNGVFMPKERRLFHMGGFLAFPEEHDNRQAMIYEYDYDTEEVLNQYSLKHYFFRAMHMKPDVNDLASALDLYAEPNVGYLQPFERMEGMMEIPKAMTNEAPLECPQERVRVQIEDDNLWIKSRDHLVNQVFLIGKDNCYVRDYRKQEAQQEDVATMEYFVTMPLYSVEPGEYTVAVEFKGELYNTGETLRLIEK